LKIQAIQPENRQFVFLSFQMGEWFLGMFL